MRQTETFDHFVYDQLPKIETLDFDRQKEVVNNIVEKVVEVNVDQINYNTNFDEQNSMDNLDRMLRKSLKKSGFRMKE